MAGVETVIDAGPIPYDAMPLHGDPDLEHGLRHVGLEPEDTSYRPIEVSLDAIGDVRSMPRWQNMGHTYIDLVREGVELPPIVVMPTRSGWTLVDGVNRTYAYWALGRATIRAYDLIEASRLHV
ncbi:MAG TPA: hypothetical protein VFI99_13825 [Nocardioides sp.]|jgi:hypothetical protein|nr:hypothetical protein [Nocardioides sp.]